MDENIVEENNYINYGINNNINNNGNNKKNKKFIISFSIFSLVLIILTVVAIYFTFQHIDNEAKERLEQYESEKGKFTFEEKPKKEADDKIYAITSYKETYHENSITIKEIEDYGVNYVEIDGLKNTQIQKNINEKIRNTAYSFNNKNIYTYVTANFSNVLSLIFYSEDESEKTLNIDLVTGDDIPFEKVFVSSAPINLYLSEGLYEAMAWDGIDYEDDNWEKMLNMDYRDTSEYEDKFLILARKYEKQKDNLVYSISPTGVSIHGLGDGIINENSYININFVEHAEEVAIYKRYLTKESIYKDDKLGIKGTLIFSDNSIYRDENMFIRLSYGNLTDNIFMEESVQCYNNAYDNKVVKNFIDELSKNNKAQIKKKIKSNEGAIYQIQYGFNIEDEGYYCIYYNSAIATCSKKYFEEDAFKDYAMLQIMPIVDATMRMFNGYYDISDNLKVVNEDKQYFISSDGELLGNTIEEVNTKLHPTPTTEGQDEQQDQTIN